MPFLLGVAAAGGGDGGGGTPVDVSARVAANDDSATAVAWASWRGNDESLYIDDSTVRSNNTNLRFPGLEIPQGATITSAVITIWAANTVTGFVGGEGLTVGAEQADNATAPTSYESHTSKSGNIGTTARWAYSTWSSGSPISSPDLSALVQQIVNRGGWPDGTGGAIQFYLQNDTTGSHSWSTNPQAYSYYTASSADLRPLIEITYVS